MNRGAVIVTENVNETSLSAAIDDYLEETKLTKKPKTLAAYTTALAYFTESCHKLTIKDIEALHPFHWGYEFDEILNKRGGFDAIITNPPWEGFKPLDKEFAKEHDPEIERRGTDIKDFEKRFIRSRRGE